MQERMSVVDDALEDIEEGAAARYGLSEADVQSMINAAISGAIEGAY